MKNKFSPYCPSFHYLRQVQFFSKDKGRKPFTMHYGIKKLISCNESCARLLFTYSIIFYTGNKVKKRMPLNDKTTAIHSFLLGFFSVK